MVVFHGCFSWLFFMVVFFVDLSFVYLSLFDHFFFQDLLCGTDGAHLRMQRRRLKHGSQPRPAPDVQSLVGQSSFERSVEFHHVGHDQPHATPQTCVVLDGIEHQRRHALQHRWPQDATGRGTERPVRSFLFLGVLHGSDRHDKFIFLTDSYFFLTMNFFFLFISCFLTGWCGPTWSNTPASTVGCILRSTWGRCKKSHHH
jgi:hypothetical protein